MTDPRRNIVLCLDGTGNRIKENISNVLKLYRSLDQNEMQIVYYDQGVGTLGRIYTWGRLKQKISTFLGLAFGQGLDENVLQAYDYLVRHYREYDIEIDGKKKTRGDHIFIFGFSRGAHTARVLAGLIYEIGILKPDQINLSGAALTAYKQSQDVHFAVNAVSEDDYEGTGSNFRRVIKTRTAAIRFLGLWDTVSSVYIPNHRKIWPPIIRENLPHTAVNPAVQTVRQAIAVDEFRRMFRIDHWTPDQRFKPNFYANGSGEPQDLKEVWFPGCHSDVGGGYPKDDSGLSQFSLIWMLEEAKLSGLRIFKKMADYVTGEKTWSSNTNYIYPKADVTAELHKSVMERGWWFFEILPKRAKKGVKPFQRPSLFRWYFPLAERRRIAKDAVLHESVAERMKQVEDYRPQNLPKVD